MISKLEITNIVKNSFYQVIENNKNYSKNKEFIGPNSEFESIEIVQIISNIEDNLELKGIEGFDLFENIYEYEKLSFEELINLVESNIIKN
tara:strand:- start:1238 stop:1510 length:273 start_codon:yes stop_codon:yes gene_type:complete